MNSLISAAAGFPLQAQDAGLTVYQLTVAGILAAAIVGIVLGIMTYMANHNRDIVQSEVKPVVARLDGIDKHLEQIDIRLENMDTRFESIDIRLDKMDTRFDRIDMRMDKMDERFDKMDERFDKMDQRFDKMDERMDRMEVKLDKVADDVGVLVQVVKRLVESR
ncbi:hypothetical protein [Cupriavidus sp. D384]|uniref:hypothetical protein n=1 Tax=Cupriavidus sp. D384 TaxID=1538095 RepID=UPI00082CB7F3|nr:hypothetical protein [Cupriavidus sp. D384]